jgi:hypothetical protein
MDAKGYFASPSAYDRRDIAKAYFAEIAPVIPVESAASM